MIKLLKKIFCKKESNYKFESHNNDLTFFDVSLVDSSLVPECQRFDLSLADWTNNVTSIDLSSADLTHLDFSALSSGYIGESVFMGDLVSQIENAKNTKYPSIMILKT